MSFGRNVSRIVSTAALAAWVALALAPGFGGPLPALGDEPKPAPTPAPSPAPSAKPAPPASTPAPATAPAQPAAPAPKSDVTAIVGGDIDTVSREVIRNGVILVKDGKILRVGQGIEVPPGATVIDAKGKRITPGFVAARMSGIGLSGGGGGRFGGRQGGPSGGGSRMEDSLDPFDRAIKYSLGVGITSGCVYNMSAPSFRFGRNFVDRDQEQARLAQDAAALAEEPNSPRDLGEEILLSIATGGQEAWLDSLHDHDHGPAGASDPICAFCAQTTIPRLGSPLSQRPRGLEPGPASAPNAQPFEPIEFGSRGGAPSMRPHAILKLAYGRLKEMMVRETPFHDTSYAAISGPSNRFNWRDNLSKAKKYVNDLAAHERAVKEGKKSSAPSKTAGDLYIQIVKQELPVRVSATTAGQIRDMIVLAKEFGYKLVLDDAHEAWLVADEIASAKAFVVLVPRSLREPLPGKEDTTGSSIETSRYLEKAGAPFAVATMIDGVSTMGLAGRDLTSLPLEAAFAVRGGCDEKTALAALTLTPARMLGIDDRVGSIDEGKDADLLILNGPPLDYRTYVEKALVNGKVAYDRKADAVYPVFERDGK